MTTSPVGLKCFWALFLLKCKSLSDCGYRYSSQNHGLRFFLSNCWKVDLIGDSVGISECVLWWWAWRMTKKKKKKPNEPISWWLPENFREKTQNPGWRLSISDFQGREEREEGSERSVGFLSGEINSFIKTNTYILTMPGLSKPFQALPTELPLAPPPITDYGCRQEHPSSNMGERK